MKKLIEQIIIQEISKTKQIFGINYNNEELYSFIKKNRNNKNMYFQYSDIEMLKINPGYDWWTPRGIYGFPLYYRNPLNSKKSVFNQRKYIIFFKIKDEYISNFLNLEKNKEINHDIDDLFFKHAHQDQVEYNFAKKNNRAKKSKYGKDNIVDELLKKQIYGIIDSRSYVSFDIEYQTVSFSKQYIQEIAIFNNPAYFKAQKEERNNK